MTQRIPEQGASARFLAGLPEQLREKLETFAKALPALPEVPAGAAARPPRSKPTDSSAKARRAAGKNEKRQQARERHERRLRRQQCADAKRLEKLRLAIIENGGADAVPPGIPGNQWRQWWVCRNDRSGRALELKLRNEPNKVAVGLIRQATVGTLDAPTGESWADDRTRCIATLAIMFLSLAEPTKRKGRWQGFVRGYGRGVFCNGLMDAFDKRPACPENFEELEPARSESAERARAARRARRPAVPSLEAVFGSYASPNRKDKTYLSALYDVGFFYAQQLPRDAPGVLPCEIAGVSGHTINRYWIVAAYADDTVDDATRAELLAAICAGAPLRVVRGGLTAAQATAPPPEPPY